MIKEDGYTMPIVVAPLAGAWIEIVYPVTYLYGSFVAPLAGAWIERPIPTHLPAFQRSHPLLAHDYIAYVRCCLRCFRELVYELGYAPMTRISKIGLFPAHAG